MPRPFARHHLARPRSALRDSIRDRFGDRFDDRAAESPRDLPSLTRQDRRRDARARDLRARTTGSRATGSRQIASLCAKRALKAAALRDCGRRCVYCATHLAPEAATLDHVVPRSQGGADAPGNVVAACAPCNRMKADLHPTEFFLRHPWAGENFVRYARTVHRALKRGARRAVSLAYAA